jgi:hypothetical protein
VLLGFGLVLYCVCVCVCVCVCLIATRKAFIKDTPFLTALLTATLRQYYEVKFAEATLFLSLTVQTRRFVSLRISRTARPIVISLFSSLLFSSLLFSLSREPLYMSTPLLHHEYTLAVRTALVGAHSPVSVLSQAPVSPPTWSVSSPTLSDRLRELVAQPSGSLLEAKRIVDGVSFSLLVCRTCGVLWVVRVLAGVCTPN